MSRTLHITMKSGNVYNFPLGPEHAAKAPIECAKEFHDGFDFANTVSLRIEDYVFYTREIESFSFS